MTFDWSCCARRPPVVRTAWHSNLNSKGMQFFVTLCSGWFYIWSISKSKLWCCSIFGLRFSLVNVIFSCLEFFFVVIYQYYVQATLFVRFHYLPILPFVLNFWSHLEEACAAKAQRIFLCGNTSLHRWVTIKQIRLLLIHRLSCNIAKLCLKGCKTIAHIATTFSWITATKPLVNALLWHFNLIWMHTAMLLCFYSALVCKHSDIKIFMVWQDQSGLWYEF